MIKQFIAFLGEQGITKEYVALAGAHRKHAQMWLERVEPYQYIYDAFPGSREGKWGGAHIQWMKEVGPSA